MQLITAETKRPVSDLTKYFDPETLARIRPLGIRARTLVEGLVAGLHRSPLRGQSLEFSQHREYVPGDDLRQVDWKVFARSDKYYVRQYEDETNLTAMLLLDQSESMEYRSNPNGLTKLQYGELIACSLVFLVTAQQDSVGVATFTDQIHHWLRPSSSPAQMDDVVRLLELPSASHSKQSNMPEVLSQCSNRLAKPNLLIVISDLMDDLPEVLKRISVLRRAGHDLLVLHLLDPWEQSFPFDTSCEFQGLEQQGLVTADPLLIAAAYRKAMADFCDQAEQGCLKLNCDYFRITTDLPLSVALPDVLSRRLMRGR
jgi:uncharacterized protein (DUF58 family)